MYSLTLMLGLCSMLPIAANVAGDPPSGQESKLQPADLVGVYNIVSGEKFGLKEPADRIEGSIVRFSDDRVVVVDKDKKEVYGASYKLDPGARGCKIMMTSKLSANDGEIARGLIEKNGDTVRLIYALPGGEEPKDFKTKEKQLMFEMKKTSE
jgi:uncharacterized protein (TIGR03067 family)